MRTFVSFCTSTSDSMGTVPVECKTTGTRSVVPGISYLAMI